MLFYLWYNLGDSVLGSHSVLTAVIQYYAVIWCHSITNCSKNFHSVIHAVIQYCNAVIQYFAVF